MAAQCERVLVFARHLVLLRDTLRGLPHLQRAIHLGHLRVDQAPAQRGVVRRLRAARKRPVGLGHHPRRAGHALDAARDDDVGGARLDLARRGDGRLHSRAAQAVDGLPRYLDRKPRQQERHARDVAVVLAGAVGAAEDDVFDLGRFDMSALTHLLEDDRGEVIRADVLQLAAVPPHRRARGRNDNGLTKLGHPLPPSGGGLGRGA